MKLKVKTQDDRIYTLDVNAKIYVGQLKEEVHKLDTALESNKYRILFQGRFLEDESMLDSAGIEDGHTVLLVPKPPPSRRNPQSNITNNTVGNRTHPSLRRFPPEVIRFLQAQQRVFAMIQAQREERQQGFTDEELDAMEQQPIFDNVVDVRECDMSDMMLGFVVGFLLGPIAGLCLIENTLSRHLRVGMLMGIVCEVIVALFKMATHIPKGV